MKVFIAPAFYNNGSYYTQRIAQDVYLQNDTGLVVGHTAQLTSPEISELQVLGTGGPDSRPLIGRWSADSAGPGLVFIKSRDPIIADGTFATVVDNDQVAIFRFYADDGTDLATEVARHMVEVDDASVEAGGIGAAFVWKQMPGGGTTAAQETMRLDASGTLYIGDDANADMTTGLTINQGAADDQAFALKSSDVAHSRVSVSEADDFYTIGKAQGIGGGGSVRYLADGDSTNGLSAFHQVYMEGAYNTTKTTSGLALFTIDARGISGDADANVGADSNIFSVRALVGGSSVLRFLVDEDGDMYSVTSAQTFDEFDDAQMVRALDQAKGDVVRGRWDDYVAYNEQALIDVGVLGGPIREGGMTNVTQLQRLHNGAIWQGYVRQQEMQERIDTLESRFLAIEGAK